MENKWEILDFYPFQVDFIPKFTIFIPKSTLKETKNIYIFAPSKQRIELLPTIK